MNKNELISEIYEFEKELEKIMIDVYCLEINSSLILSMRVYYFGK